MPLSSQGMATSRRSFLRRFLKFELAAIAIFLATSAAAASAEDEDEAKGSTAMEWERCLSAFGTVAVWGGGNIWMEGVAPMKGEGPAKG